MMVFCDTSFSQKSRSELPLPRFASIRSDKVNIRTGPGFRYPIKWVYQRRNMPIEIIAEFETWRKVKDWQNTLGWVHQSMLSASRTLIIVNSPQVIRKDDAAESAAVAEAEPGVVGKIKKCMPDNTWCYIKIGEYNGWLRRTQIWGVYPMELVE